MISKLTDIQSLLPPQCRNDAISRSKLLNSVRDVSECRLTYHKHADIIRGVISDSHELLSTRKNFVGPSSLQQSFLARLVDQRYYHDDNRKPKSRFRQEKPEKQCFGGSLGFGQLATAQKPTTFIKEKQVAKTFHLQAV